MYMYTTNFSIVYLIMLFMFYFLNKNFILLLDMKMFSFLNINLSLIWNSSSKLFFIFFFLISMMAVIYSFFYMKTSLFISRFFLVKFLFILSMFFLIFMKSIFMIFVGWDGLGVSSFCLILFFFNFKSQNSGITTILTNRIGDSIFIVIILINLTNNTYFLKFMFNNFFLVMLFIILVLTKSAQFPFSSWLPLAMAAPTPISALVHSSTLVAAGIYLFIDNFSFFNSKYMIFSIFLITSFTCLMSGLNSMLEMDMKKIIALSTLNQLSLMFFTCSLNLIILSYFHLISHAIFKSLLFLNSGVIIHFWMNSQEYRTFNSMINISWFLQMSMIISLMNLMGMIFLSGFYSKDIIIMNMELMWVMIFIFIFLMIFAFTFFYSMRLMVMCFFSFSKKNMIKYVFKELIFYTPILVLTITSLFFGNWFFFFYLFKTSPTNLNQFILFNFVILLFWLLNKFLMKNFIFFFFNSMMNLNKIMEMFSNMMKSFINMKKNIENGIMSMFFVMIYFYTKNFFFFMNFKQPKIIFFFLFILIFIIMLFFVNKVLKLLFIFKMNNYMNW